jgi:hypothetical protein
MNKIACCNVCDPAEPLVITFEFKYHEYICMKCGSLFGFLGVRREDSTDDLSAKHLSNLEKYNTEREERKLAKNESE